MAKKSNFCCYDRRENEVSKWKIIFSLNVSHPYVSVSVFCVRHTHWCKYCSFLFLKRSENNGKKWHDMWTIQNQMSNLKADYNTKSLWLEYLLCRLIFLNKECFVKK